MAATEELTQEAKDAYHRLMLGELVVEVRDQADLTLGLYLPSPNSPHPNGIIDMAQLVNVFGGGCEM